MTLLEYYQRKIASGEILNDSQQLLAIQKLQTLYEALTAEEKFLRCFTSRSPKGLYLWGSVGIGKTFLMDTFYHFLPFEDKWRTHFLPFMREVRAQLYVLQGTKNPLLEIAKQWAKKTRVICFDEFAVNDVADALILGNLMDAFFSHKICMVFTSNLAPDELYKNGIQRESFLQTISKIKTHTEVIHLAMLDDYRIRYPSAIQYYWYPLTTATQQKMATTFTELANNSPLIGAPLLICGREIPVKKMTNKAVWFDFLDLCGVPRCQDDYLMLAQQFEAVFISNLQPIRANESDLVRSFIQLIDILYDAKVRLVISAALPIDQIYTAGKLVFEFNRTRSRLIQMQSATWECKR